jgi:hypothetical protein
MSENTVNAALRRLGYGRVGRGSGPGFMMRPSGVGGCGVASAAPLSHLKMEFQRKTI